MLWLKFLFYVSFYKKHARSGIEKTVSYSVCTGGGARGGLEGAIAPYRNMLPSSEREKLFCWRFLAFAIP